MKYYLYLTAFVTGAVIMGLEMLGFRLFAPFFGYTIYVWGSLIGMVMMALTLGYTIGGRLADRSGKLSLLYILILVAALYLLPIYYFFPKLVAPMLGWHLIPATLMTSLLAYGVPMVCLSVTSPFIIGVSAKSGNIGTTAGKVYAISTAGSILGTFLTAFYLVPSFGTKKTLLFCFILLLLISLLGLFKSFGKKAFFVLGLIPLGFLPHHDYYQDLLTQGKKNILYHGESKYSHIFILEDPFTNLITLHSKLAIAESALYRHRILSGRFLFWDFFTLGPILRPATEELLFMGVAGGSSLRQLLYFFPQLTIDAVELDEKMIQASKDILGLKESDRLRLHIADARPFLMRSNQKYGAVGIDISGAGLNVPFYAASLEFYTLVRNHMREDGVLIMNISGPGEALMNTVASVFPSVFRLEESSILIAFPHAVPLEEVKAKFREWNVFQMEVALEDPYHLTEVNPQEEKFAFGDLLVKAWETVIPISFNPKEWVLSDDLSPIEQISYQLYTERYRSAH